MTVYFTLKESMYDCNIRITDSKGMRFYHIPSATSDDPSALPYVSAEVFDSSFDLALAPITPDITSSENAFEQNTLKDKLSKKATDFLVSSLDKLILRVGCSYRVEGIQDGDRLVINLQGCVFGASDLYDLLGLVPLIYAFFEVSRFNTRYKLTDTLPLNRKDVIKASGTLAFAYGAGNGCLGMLISYPIQKARIRHLTRDKTVSSFLKRFNSFSEKERQEFLNKQESRF